MTTPVARTALSDGAGVAAGSHAPHKLGRVIISAGQLAHRMQEIGTQLNDAEYAHGTPLFVCVLKGSARFYLGVLAHVTVPYVEEYVAVSSMDGAESTGIVTERLGIRADVRGRHVVLFEDIVDKGHTIRRLRQDLIDAGAARVDIVTLLHKPEATEHDIPLWIVGFAVALVFVVGFGLDYNELYRGLKDIRELVLLPEQAVSRSN